jgi:pyrrolysine biosynthesis protein PylD
MSRLLETDIADISGMLQSKDAFWKKTLGYTLEEIARRAAGFSGTGAHLRAAVVPVSAGLGIIGGFSQTVAAILRHCGADAWVTDYTDVAGMQEAYAEGTDLVFMADEAVFMAFSPRDRIYSDNGWATGTAFAAALELMMDDPPGAKALVLGAGPVGSAAAAYLARTGAAVTLYDTDTAKMHKAAESLPGVRAAQGAVKLRNYSYILNAATAANFITPENVSEDTRISAPGMPLGVTREAMDKALVFHNPLELGVMTMYFDCLGQLEKAEGGVRRGGN